MTFQEFIEIKQAQAIVEHLETLGEAQAIELLEQLDDATVELIEQILDEGSRGEKRAGRVMAALRKKMYPYAVWQGAEGGGAEEMEKTKELEAQHANVLAGLRASGRSVRGALRGAEQIRSGLSRSEVDETRKQRGEGKQSRIDDPRSSKLRSLVRMNKERP